MGLLQVSTILFSEYSSPHFSFLIHSPITSTTDPDLACNNPGTTVSPQLSASVAAGSAITAYWNAPWPHNIGPMMTYMANCNGDCTSAEPAALEWVRPSPSPSHPIDQLNLPQQFKIDEAGLLSGTVADGYWGSGQMIAQNSSWTSTIPSATPSGSYMIRFETLAIHTANQPQFYAECAQLTVTGGGSGSPGPTVVFPGGYSATDPSIDIDVYSSTATTYA